MVNGATCVQCRLRTEFWASDENVVKNLGYSFSLKKQDSKNGISCICKGNDLLVYHQAI